MKDHQLAGKRVVTLLFSLAATLLAAASCSSEASTDNGRGGTSMCTLPQVQCSGACVDTSTSVAHCGMCGKACATGQLCVNGTCSSTLPGGGGAANGGTVSSGGVGTPASGNGGTGNAGPGGTSPGGVANGGVVNAGGTGNVVSGGGQAQGGVGPVGGTSGGIASGGIASGGAQTGNNPPGYWTYNDWHGCVWTGIDTLSGSTTMNNPKDFTAGVMNGSYCVNGTVHPDYDAVALLGFNLAEPNTASCEYKPVDINAPGPPAVMLPGTGIAVNFTKKVASTLRIQIQGPNGAKDPNDRWCYTITDPEGPIHATWDKFNTECWEGGMGTPPMMSGTNLAQPISAVVFLVPGATNATAFDYCINGFAAGTSAADAPTGGGMSGPLTGTIGGPGSTDLDFQRVKVKAGGKSYIIQNNNWGRPESSDQLIRYSGNSFKIESSTGTKGGNGEPASFPSIFIGGNGDTQNGLYSTRSDDNLPKAINAIQTINTTFKYNRASGDLNATYDVWFADKAPTAPYNDGISGFLMVWLYKPPGNSPIGNSPVRTGVSVSGVPGTWDVWVGPRASGPSPNAPVISYVATSAVTSLTFDLKKFIDDSIANNHGLKPEWLLTDVFAGFEIWTGSAANGLELTEFTAVVQ